MHRALLVVALLASGCTAVLGINDVFYDERASQGAEDSGPDAAGGPDGAVTPGDGGDDAAACVADLQTDAKHCGRCGHDCLGGSCTAGRCSALEIGAVANARLRRVVVSDTDVFVSSSVDLVSDPGGIWRVPKSGGTPTQFVTLTYAAGMVVVGQSLYFVVADEAAKDGVTFGGLYECPLAPSACASPKLIAPSTDSYGLVFDKGRLLYADRAAGKEAIVAYTPGGPAPTPFRPGFAPTTLWVDGEEVFYAATFYSGTPRASVFRVHPDGGFAEIYSYPSPSAVHGALTGSPSALYFAAYDDGQTGGGVVRRLPRAPGVTPCDYGGSANARPGASYADGQHLYWTNAGEGPEPWKNGSVARCALAGCCAAPEAVLWTGDTTPAGLTGDERAVYWVGSANGSIWKVAKP